MVPMFSLTTPKANLVAEQRLSDRASPCFSPGLLALTLESVLYPVFGLFCRAGPCYGQDYFAPCVNVCTVISVYAPHLLRIFFFEKKRSRMAAQVRISRGRNGVEPVSFLEPCC